MEENELNSEISHNSLYRPDFEKGIWMVWQLGEKDPWDYFENKYGHARYAAIGSNKIQVPEYIKVIKMQVPKGVIWIC